MNESLFWMYVGEYALLKPVYKINAVTKGLGIWRNVSKTE